MATIHRHHHHHHNHHHNSTATPTPTATTPYLRRHSLDFYSSSSTPTFSTLKHSHFTTFSLSTSASTSASPPITTTSTSPFSLGVLERCLAEANFRQADEETRRLLIVLAGEAAIKRGYVFFSEVRFIPKEDLKAIDNLWLKYSNNRFGYSVQKKIWVKADKDFTKFFIKVSWMKKLDTEIEQYNYRSFPSEFIWELNLNNNTSSVKRETVSQETTGSSNDVISEVAPEGHLPLTNALRGTQLLNMIFNHPAFDEGNDEEKRNEENNNYADDNDVVIEEVGKKKSRLASLRDKLFKPNYSF